MFEFPIEKYKFYINGNKVIAVSTYAGKTVRGVAICANSDNFDLEKGKQLAAARCNLKVAQKRQARAKSMLEEADMFWTQAQEYLLSSDCYLHDADIALCAAEERLAKLENEY